MFRPSDATPPDLLEHHRRLFAWDDWANRETLASLSLGGDPPGRSLKLLGHIAGAERLWLGRLRQDPVLAAVWPELDVAACRAAFDDLASLWKEFLGGLTPARLEETTFYVNSKGEPWTSAVEDILTHVIQHSSYHRGQIASDMRASGRVPAYTDYIHARRQRLVK